jgi:beta-galactosidase/beta-glucuronidase
MTFMSDCVDQVSFSLLLGLHAEKQQFEGELVCMVENHRSFPSVVMYVVFNEGWGQYEVSLSLYVM